MSDSSWVALPDTFRWEPRHSMGPNDTTDATEQANGQALEFERREEDTSFWGCLRLLSL